MVIYALGGLGVDARVFDFLELPLEVVGIDWVQPFKRETIHDYARRLSSQINTDEPFLLMGVSFGGMMAVELSKLLRPEKTILISSASTRKDLKLIYRVVGRTRICRIIPKRLFVPPVWLAQWLFGAKNKGLLSQFLKETDRTFAKWAVNALLEWTNTTDIPNTIKINGRSDRLIKPKNGRDTIWIEKGHHFMVVDLAAKVSKGVVVNLGAIV